MATWRQEVTFLVFKNILNIFQRWKKNFVSPRSHVISSILTRGFHALRISCRRIQPYENRAFKKCKINN